MIKSIISIFLLSALVIACSENVITGRKQFKLLPEAEVQAMATTEYRISFYK